VEAPLDDLLRDSDRIASLLARYDRPGPRYTSYPPAPRWHGDFSPRALVQALAEGSGDEISLYVHVPFCRHLCAFCACNRTIPRSHAVVAPYLQGVAAEAELLAKAAGRPLRCAQLAIGGGSPNYLSAAELEQLFGSLERTFPAAPGAERSVELDPRATDPEQLEVLAAAGVNRISLGVQDTSPRVQQAIHRIQPWPQVERLAGHARRLGIASVNLDLIYGLPFQSVDSFRETLRLVTALRPDRIALYSYAHVTWISKTQRSFESRDLPSAQRKLEIFGMAIHQLREAGYTFLGLDHFALPQDELCHAHRTGTLHRNFMGYTTRAGLELLALGPSGISELAGCYAQSQRTEAAWRDQIRGGHLATARGIHLSAQDLERKWLIQDLMCRGAIDPPEFEARFGAPLAARVPGLAQHLQPFVNDGLLREAALGDVRAGWRVAPLGRLFLRNLAMCLDAGLERPEVGPPRYSRTV